jgi:hypothetical protein
VQGRDLFGPGPSDIAGRRRDPGSQRAVSAPRREIVVVIMGGRWSGFHFKHSLIGQPDRSRRLAQGRGNMIGRSARN